MAFRQIHKVLGMDMLPQPKFTPKYNNYRFGRKRRRDNSNGEGNDSEGEYSCSNVSSFMKLSLLLVGKFFTVDFHLAMPNYWKFRIILSLIAKYMSITKFKLL